jgi:thioredoxin-dependent peroxiredoxin
VIEQETKAHDFTVKNSYEQEISLSDFQGKWVVLYFYPKDNTPGCTLEALEFTALKKEFHKHNAVVIGLSTDSCASHAKFTNKHNLDLVLLSDPDHAVAENYGVWKPKKFMGKEFLGVVRSTFLINQQGIIAYSWPKVSAKGHAQAVLDKLRELKNSMLMGSVPNEYS